MEIFNDTSNLIILIGVRQFYNWMYQILYHDLYALVNERFW